MVVSVGLVSYFIDFISKKGWEKMRKVLSYLKDFKKECILAPIFKMLEATFELLVPLVMAAVIDTGIKMSDKGYILKMSLLLILFGVIGLISSVTAQFFAAKAATGFSTKLRHGLFSHIQTFSFTELDSIGTSTLITRMTSDINQAQNGVNMFLRLFLRSPFIVFGAMIMAFTIDVKAALIFVITIPILSFVVYLIMKITIPGYKRVQGSLDLVMRNTRENLAGTRVIRAFNQQEEEKERFCKDHDTLTNLQLFIGKISGSMNPLTYILINLAIVCLLYVGAFRVNVGGIKQGELVALVNYMSQILVELIKLANLIITLTKATASIGRINLIFAIEPSMQEQISEEDKKNAITQDAKTRQDVLFQKENEKKQLIFSNVSFSYQNAAENAILDLNFSIEKGEMIGIIGGTGSGKTTLTNLILRFYDATKGSIFFHGRDLKTIPMDELRKKIGVVMQKAVLFEGTVRKNLLWGNEMASTQEMWEALTIAQAKEFVTEKSDGLDAYVEQDGKNFSGGQRQRLSIARTLLQKPEILILDDSFSALDYATDAKLRKALTKLTPRPTIFMVTQRVTSIQHADKIMVLDDGKVSGMGTHEQLLQTNEIYREIYTSQVEKEEKVDA